MVPPRDTPAPNRANGLAGGDQLATQLARALDHRKKITVAVSGVGATSKMAAGIRSAQIQPKHREAAVLEG